MQYYNILIVLFSHLQNGNRGEGSQPQSAVAGPRQLVEHARASLATLLHLFYRRHGFSSYHFILVSILSQLGFGSINQLASRDSLGSRSREVARATLILSATGLLDQGDNFYLADVVLCMLRDAMSPEDALVLQENSKYDDTDERRAVVAREVRGDWPAYVADITQESDIMRIDRLAQAYGRLRVQDMGNSSSSDEHAAGSGDVVRGPSATVASGASSASGASGFSGTRSGSEKSSRV